VALVHALNATPGLNFPDAGDVGTTPGNFNPNITQYDDDQGPLIDCLLLRQLRHPS